MLALRLLYENPAYMTVLPLYTVKKSIHEKSLAAVRVEDCKMSQFRQVIYHKNKGSSPADSGDAGYHRRGRQAAVLKKT